MTAFGRPSFIAAIISVCLTLLSPGAIAAVDIGVASAVRPDARGTPPDQASRLLHVGVDLFANELIETGRSGQTHILFRDGSALSVGPNSSLQLDTFVYDPKAKEGELVVAATKGVFRFVGGRISKKTPVLFKSPTAVIGIRGGVAMIELAGAGAPVPASVTMLFGEEVFMESGGNRQTMYSPGFVLSQDASGSIGEPNRATPEQLNATLAKLEDPPADEEDGGTLGALAPAAGGVAVSDEDVAQSQLNELGSNNNPQTVASADTGSQPTDARRTSQAASSEATTASQREATDTSTQSEPEDPTEEEEEEQVTTGGQTQTQTQTEPQPETETTENTETEDPPAAPTPIDITGSLAGRVKNATTPSVGTDGGAGNLAFGNATAANGILNAPLDPDFISTIAAGTFTPTVSSQPFDTSTLTGSAVLNAAEDFVVYELTNSSTGARVLAYAGIPTPTSALNQTGFGFYTLRDDFVLDSGVPFVRGINGGNVSVPGSGDAIIDWDASFGANLLAWRAVISGQGASQTSAIGVLLGRTFSFSNNETAGINGLMRGSSRPSGSNRIFTYNTSIITERASSPSVAFYGANGPDAFNIVPFSSANEFVDNTQSTFQPNTIAMSSTGTVGNRASHTINGYVSGPVQTINSAGAIVSTFLLREASDCCSSPNPTFPGDFVLQTNAVNGTLSFSSFHLLDLEDDLGEELEIDFGGIGIGRGVYIDDTTFAATEEATSNNYRVPSLAMNPSVTARTYLVTGNLLDHSGFLPSGVEFCNCEYVSWGFWGGDFQDTFGNRARTHMGTFAAGADVCNGCQLPTSGVATFNGHMIGNVLNNGDHYLAAGQYQQVVTFAPGSAYTFDVTVTNFDGQNFSKTGNNGFGGQHAAEIISGGRTLRIRNSFFQGGGDTTAEIAGSFMIRGPNYDAAGNIAASKVVP